MPIINSSEYLYGAIWRDASFDIEIEIAADFAPVVYNPFVDAEFDARIELSGDFNAVSHSPFIDASFDVAIELAGDFIADAFYPGDAAFDCEIAADFDFEADASLALSSPPPITETVSPLAFSNQFYKQRPRLFINGVRTPFLSAEIIAPGKTLGKSVAVELARADLAQIPADAVFRLEIYRWNGATLDTFVVADGGKLTGRSFRMSNGRDGLSISIKTAADQLDKCPVNNLIVYDPAKTSVETSEIEAIPTSTGEFVGTSKSAVGVLSLKKLLEVAFVEGCGFSSVITDIPNYEITRCDFSVTGTYASAVAPFIGVYEPEFSVKDNVLTIRKTIDPLPLDFTPNALYASRYPNFTESADYSSSNIDGFLINYTARAGTSFFDRNLPEEIEPSGGQFGDADFTETRINRKMRDWYEDGAVVRSELKQETRETKRAGVTVGMEILINSFDALGRNKGYSRELHARMPDVSSGGVPLLLKTREEAQKITYKSNPFAPRQTIQSKIETSVRGLLAIDSDNTALDANGEDAPYLQDYEKVFEAGNLKKEMTSAFQTLENTVEYFRPTAAGQIECRTERFDALRGKPKPPISDVRSGDISVPNFTKQKTKTIFKSGVTQATRTGKPLVPLNVGELPLFFAEPLANWLLANGRITANVEITGYDESIERGVFFALKGREAEDLGNYLISGYRVLIEPEKITTTIDALKV